MGNFRDVLIDQDANATITEFMRRKIRSRVKDPKVAEKLIPTNHGFGTRRVPLESGYYEVFNQANVHLVDVRETPIERITPAGVKTSDAEYEVDMIIYATGFDAITGAFDRIDIRGRGGRRLRDKWANGPRTYLGLQIEGFPNLFTLVGPHNAATFCNIPRCIEQNDARRMAAAPIRPMHACLMTILLGGCGCDRIQCIERDVSVCPVPWM